MKNKKEVKKIFLAIITFIVFSLAISYSMNTKINALEQEKISVIETEPIYKGDSYDETMNLSDDIVIKIIEKMDSGIDINFVNKFDELDKNNKYYYSIELSVSGNLDKIKGIESILNDLNVNYKIDKIDIKNHKNEKGNKKNYVDCLMIFKVL